MATSQGLNLRTYGDFYENKSILNSYKFGVWLNFDKYDKHIKNKYFPLAHLSRIKPYHILSVDIPFNTFNRESTSIGIIQYSYPVLSKEQALDIKLVLEEDSDGNVGRLIQELTQTVVRHGIHVAPGVSRLGDIHINMYSQQDGVINKYIAKDVFFLGAENMTASYDDSGSVQYSITFGTDYIQYDDRKYLFDISQRNTNFKSPAIFR